MIQVQIFGVKNSQATRAAERFFKERSATIHMVDLKLKPLSAGEIKRFIDKFGFRELIDTESKAYSNLNLKYIKMTESELLARAEREPLLFKLPFVRSGKILSIGQDEASWKAMAAVSSASR